VATSWTSRWSLINPDQPLSANAKLLRSLLAAVHLELDTSKVPRDVCVDVVISGGGLRGYYATGVASVLRELRDRFGWQFKRFSGASAGAWCAVFLACGLDIVDWVETFYHTKLHSEKGGLKLLDAYHCFLDSMMLVALPEDAHVICSGRVHISITIIDKGGIRNMIVSDFHSKQDLVEACMASSNIPFLSVRGFGKTFRGHRVMDGGFTNNIPAFSDGKNDQLVIDLGQVAYPVSMTLQTTDPAIEALVLRGALEMRTLVLTLPTDDEEEAEMEEGGKQQQQQQQQQRRERRRREQLADLPRRQLSSGLRAPKEGATGSLLLYPQGHAVPIVRFLPTGPRLAHVMFKQTLFLMLILLLRRLWRRGGGFPALKQLLSLRRSF